MKILITNDDGYQSVGLKKLVKSALRYGEVIVIAPKYQQSGKSHSLILRRSYEFKRVNDIFPGVETWYVDATPADCVRTAKYYMNLDIDVVFSGINDGYNIGDDIIYSGTTAAATEGVLAGYKAIAFSTTHNGFDKIDENFDMVLDHVMNEKLLDKWNLYNINIPTGAKEIKYVNQGKVYYESNYGLDENGLVEAKSILPSMWTVLDGKDTDIDNIYKKYITITPLLVDRTNYEILEKLKKNNNC